MFSPAVSPSETSGYCNYLNVTKNVILSETKNLGLPVYSCAATSGTPQEKVSHLSSDFNVKIFWHFL
jgi:hypothetical protein